MTRVIPLYSKCRAARLVCLVLAVGMALGAGSAQAARFHRGDIFLTGADGVNEYSPSGLLRQTVAGTTGASVICFDPSGRHLVLPGIGLFDRFGRPLQSSWTSVTGAQRCVADRRGHVYVSAQTDGYSITQYAIDGRPLRSFAITDPESHFLAVDLAPDECTIYYGSWGTGSLGAIRRLDACTGAPGAPFNGDGFVDDLRVLPDLQVVVTDDSSARLYDSAGQFVRNYNPEACPISSFCGGTLRTMALNPDGRSFWVCCMAFKPPTAQEVLRFDIAGGQQLAGWSPSGGDGAIAVYGRPRVGDPDDARE